MSSGEERGIVDQSSLRMREATFAAGVWLTYVVCGSSSIYVALTWQRQNRSEILALFGAGLVAAVAISHLPRERIVRSRLREVFFFSWSVVDLLLIVLASLADGGTGSPLALIFFVPVVFAAMSYPLASVAAVGGLTVAAYMSLAVIVGGASWAYEALFAVMLLCTGAMSAWQARNHERQRGALMDVSRADPLTGCLNRRGFEERALAEVGAAARRGTQGALLLLDVDHFKLVNDHHGHAAGDELLCWIVARLGEVLRPDDAIGRLGGDEFAVLFGEIEPAEALESASRIDAALSERAPCSIGLATFPMDGSDLEELTREADARLYASRHGRPETGRASTNERLSWAATLAHAVDVRMNAQHEHSRAVADNAVAIAAALGWEEEMLGMLRIAAMLHDVGKVTVPDRILCKPGRLSEEEFELIQGHSIAGAELVARVEGLATIVPWIRHSHESFDGSGYPDGLRGEAIPQASRIMLVADAFDAITSTRPYREARPAAQAREELERYAGSQFDPECVGALIEQLEAGRLGSGFSAAA
ncbi:MAG: diguanylate cyclase [Solirubrobacterales bacterium]|nr:diguanylate cyclase [Solirubrobacterales bacterium]